MTAFGGDFNGDVNGGSCSRIPLTNAAAGNVSNKSTYGGYFDMNVTTSVAETWDSACYVRGCGCALGVGWRMVQCTIFTAIVSWGRRLTLRISMYCSDSLSCGLLIRQYLGPHFCS